MPKIAYINKAFMQKGTAAIVAKANEIIEAWIAQGYKLTLRQIYYRFIALNWFPDTWIDEAYNKRHGLAPRTKNTLRNYKRLGDILNDARLRGLIDWDHMEDRTRNLMALRHWTSPKDAIDWLVDQYRKQKWNTQKIRVEVWVEKDALLGIFEDICCRPDIDVAYFSCRGYNSQSEMWNAAQRILSYEAAGQRTLILQFSDHDPSGLDMHRDIKDRLNLFGCNAIVRRMALTMKQVKKYKLPPNPAKETDIRFTGYAERYGNESWELDALEPSVLSDFVRKAVLRVRNAAKWNAATKREKLEINRMKRIKFKSK